ncbi:amidohydrolase family protein [Ekhidna sp.]|uniref:metal-dependent hydrolase family protein n=1 Tax=Ekhidna sp. TaxID=2608089 RepID=UPI003B50ECB1
MMRSIISSLLFLSVFLSVAQRVKITADQLFDGVSVQSDWGLIVEGNVILEVGPINKLGEADQEFNYPTGTIMPGMIEGHSHVLLYPYNQTGWNDQVLKESRSLRAIRGGQAATKNLYAGFTTIRDLGSEGAGYADVAIKQSIEQGIIEGPRMLVAGRAIVATGSYGPKGFHPDFDVPLGAEPADAQNLITVTRDQIGKGADFIKVYADYRWGPDGEAKPTFSIEELKMIVETAASSGRVVVTHAATAEGMRRATLAGVKTIEHGSDATMEVLQLMKENNVALCPTLAATHAVTQYFDGWDTKDPEPERITNKRKMFERALKSGVTLVAGGDVGVFPHGENVRELELMVDYGMAELDVLRSVTSINAEVFGLEKLGELKQGFLADIVVVEGNPSKSISDLYKIKLVMKDGILYKTD